MTVKVTGRGITGLAATFLVVLLILKWTGFITWPWIWVLAPLWIWGILFVLGLIIAVIFVIVGFALVGAATSRGLRR